tara:strand:+ start:787 stop:1479 length:693 start_codon:yes stop_codon:yes gene_type:complete
LKTESLLAKIRVLKNNKVYRIGDIVYCRGPKRWLMDRISIMNKPKYRNSILYNYLKEINIEEDAGNNNDGVEWDKFIKSIKNFYEDNLVNLKIDNKELCINIRCGDIVTDNQWHKSCYIFNPEKVIENVNILISDQIEKITILAAMHYGSDEIDNRFFFDKKNYDLNQKYLSFIFNFLDQNFKLPINIFCTKSDDLKFTDESFTKLIFSDSCVIDHGGFGKLINEVRSRL